MCFLNHFTRVDIFCRCTENEKYVFSGKFCRTRGEKLELASEYIIAAACGSGGLIIIVAIIVCLVCKSRNHKERQDKDYYMYAILYFIYICVSLIALIGPFCADAAWSNHKSINQFVYWHWQTR